MNSNEIPQLIASYIEAYNSKNIDGMVQLFNDDIEFRNISNGEVTVETKGIQAFRELAEQSAGVLASRCQTILACQQDGGEVQVEIDYVGILAIDLPDGPKAGDKIQLLGKSIFQISNGKISVIEDHS